jgi:phosphatidylserine/phosphatidylglycerophosphate/cardiolipin synthase-like enzyme
MKPMLSRFLVPACFFAILTAANAQPATTSSPTWHVYFSPGGEATSAIRQALNNAKSTVLVQAYSFTSAPIAEALVKAHKRGVNVQVILDKSQRTQKYSSANFLVNSGIPTRIDAAHAIAHNKVMVIDNEIVITGSFNFTKAAEERNAENLLVVKNRELAARYTDNWRHHERHSEPYSRISKHNQR